MALTVYNPGCITRNLNQGCKVWDKLRYFAKDTVWYMILPKYA